MDVICARVVHMLCVIWFWYYDYIRASRMYIILYHRTFVNDSFFFVFGRRLSRTHQLLSCNIWWYEYWNALTAATTLNSCSIFEHSRQHLTNRIIDCMNIAGTINSDVIQHPKQQRRFVNVNLNSSSSNNGRIKFLFVIHTHTCLNGDVLFSRLVDRFVCRSYGTLRRLSEAYSRFRAEKCDVCDLFRGDGCSACAWPASLRACWRAERLCGAWMHAYPYMYGCITVFIEHCEKNCRRLLDVRRRLCC